MVWSQIERQKLISSRPELHHAGISKHLGKRWRQLSPQERKPFIEEAEKLRVLHMMEFPDYKYRPKKRKRKATPSPGCSVPAPAAEEDMLRHHSDEIYLPPANINAEVEYLLRGGCWSSLLQVSYQPAPQYYARKSPAEEGWAWPQHGDLASLAGSEKEAASWEELILTTLQPAQVGEEEGGLPQDLSEFISDHSQLQHPDQQLFFLPEQENSFAISF